MARIGFCGPSYTLQSFNADCQLTQNLYPQHDESGMGKSEWQMLPTPGQTLFSQVPTFKNRASINANKRCFKVFGDTLYEIFADGTNAKIGVVLDDGNPVSWTNSATQLLIASGGTLYVYNFTTSAFSVAVNHLGAVSFVGYQAGLFVALLANSQKFQVSSPLDATTWDPTDVTQVTVFPDQVLSLIVDHGEVGLFGNTKTVWYQNTGGVFPYTPNLSSYMEQGIGAAFSLVRADNSVVWLGSDDRGNMMAWRLNGYSPVRISNHAVETAWQSYSVTSDATAYAYQEEGHTFWQISFPTANVTWIYDFATGLWHQRTFLNPVTGINEAHLSKFHTFVFGMHLVGDRNNGNVYVQSVKLVDDDGQLIQRRRRAPYVSTEAQRISHNRLYIDVEGGLDPIALPLDGVTFSTLVATPGNPLAFLGQAYLCIVAIFANGTKKVSPVSALLGCGDETYPKAVVTPQAGIISWRIYFWNSTDTAAYFLTYTQQQVADVGYILIANKIGAVGVSIDTLTQARAPRLILRWSDKNGKVWSNERFLSAGEAGDYDHRCFAMRLGSPRTSRVYEVTCTDTIPWRFIDAYLDATPGYPTTERVSAQLRKGA